jgi:hypothetical protein
VALKLTIEPIVSCNWGVSLAHYLPPQVWDVLRREVYARACYACEICGEGSLELHCHEVWAYDDKKKTQTLVKLQSLCKKCHCIKHWGNTVAQTHKGLYPNNYLQVLATHFCKVNDCTPQQFLEYRTQMGGLGHARSTMKYKLLWGKYDPNKIVLLWSKKR